MKKNAIAECLPGLSHYQMLNAEQQEKCRGFFDEILLQGDIIYPGKLAKKLSVDTLIVYLLLEELKKQGLLEVVYKVFCPDCGRGEKNYLHSLVDFDLESHCRFCGSQLAMENLLVRYRIES